MTLPWKHIALASVLSAVAFADASAQGIRHAIGGGSGGPHSIQLGLSVEAEPEYGGACKDCNSVHGLGSVTGSALYGGFVSATMTVRRHGERYSAVVKELHAELGKPDPACHAKCPPDKRGQPRAGLEMIWDLRPDGPALVDGYLLDPTEWKRRARHENSAG